eukprot:Skav201478  [mRNA]  locus=scaffold828:52973:53338:- [translate_table: standard]
MSQALMLIDSADALNSEAKALGDHGSAGREGELGRERLLGSQPGIEGGVQLDVKDSTGRTALHCAASRGSRAVTEMLLDAGRRDRLVALMASCDW